MILAARIQDVASNMGDTVIRVGSDPRTGLSVQQQNRCEGFGCPEGARSNTHSGMIALAENRIFTLRIELNGSNPLIFRTVKVSGDIGLDGLHDVIQRAMGWTDSHLHHFIVGKRFYGIPDPSAGAYGITVHDEEDYSLSDIAPRRGSKFTYEYDFGDSWMHTIKVEQVVVDDPDFKGPVCIGGANACPPEDVGGLWGYANMLEALADPSHEEHESYVHWIGRKFDPAKFDLKKVNRMLKGLKI